MFLRAGSRINPRGMDDGSTGTRATVGGDRTRGSGCAEQLRTCINFTWCPLAGDQTPTHCTALLQTLSVVHVCSERRCEVIANAVRAARAGGPPAGVPVAESEDSCTVRRRSRRYAVSGRCRLDIEPAY